MLIINFKAEYVIANKMSSNEILVITMLATYITGEKFVYQLQEEKNCPTRNQ